jgi:hypothetical protein
MLTTEPSGSGMQATLRASGFLRFLPAAFLAAWLCGWAVGEWFALRLLASLARTLLGWSFLANAFPPLGGQMPGGPMVVVFVLFITLWLTLWTVGGVGAFHQLLWLLFGRDTVRWGGDALEAEHAALWFVSRDRLDARAVTGFRRFRGCVVADSREAAVRVTRLGSDDERRELCAMLEAWRATIAPPEPLAQDRSPIPAFTAFRDETGAIALERPRGPRRSSGVWLGALALSLFAAVGALFSQKTGVALVVGELFLTLLGVVSMIGSLWLIAARESWHLRPGKMECRRTWFGRTWTAEFVPLELQLSSASDSDGDMRWALVVSGAGRRHTIASAIDDPNLPLTLGTWLAERTGARFVRRDFEPTLRRAG